MLGLFKSDFTWNCKNPMSIISYFHNIHIIPKTGKFHVSFLGNFIENLNWESYILNSLKGNLLRNNMLYFFVVVF